MRQLYTQFFFRCKTLKILQSDQTAKFFVAHKSRYRAESDLLFLFFFVKVGLHPTNVDLVLHNNSADSGRKLTLLYVANDVLQNSKKKGPEYRTEFIKVLPRVFQGINK